MLVCRSKPTPISNEVLESLCEGAETIEQDAHGPKVLRLTDGTYLKFFRRKRFLSSATIWPYASRFVENASALIERGVSAPQVLKFHQTLDKNRMVVHYRAVEGASLKTLLESGSAPSDLAKNTAAFVRCLHNKGVYFRSLHPANIILMPDQRFGLIDVSDLQLLDRPLPNRLRARNIRHITRLKDEPQQTDEFQKALAQQLETSTTS